MSRGGSSARRQRLLRERARRDALTGLDGQARLRAALDSLVHDAGASDPDVVVVNNGAKAPAIIDTRGATGDWVIEQLIPTGVVAAIADLDDGSPAEVLAHGYDVVLYLHTRGRADGPFLFEPLWRHGLRPGENPPPPFWVRQTPTGFVPCDPPGKAAA